MFLRFYWASSCKVSRIDILFTCVSLFPCMWVPVISLWFNAMHGFLNNNKMAPHHIACMGKIISQHATKHKKNPPQHANMRGNFHSIKLFEINNFFVLFLQIFIVHTIKFAFKYIAKHYRNKPTMCGVSSSWLNACALQRGIHILFIQYLLGLTFTLRRCLGTVF